MLHEKGIGRLFLPSCIAFRRRRRRLRGHNGAATLRLAIRHRAFLFNSWFLLALSFALLLGYAVLAKLYWFNAPFRGIVLAGVFYLLGTAVNLTQAAAK